MRRIFKLCSLVLISDKDTFLKMGRRGSPPPSFKFPVLCLTNLLIVYKLMSKGCQIHTQTIKDVFWYVCNVDAIVSLHCLTFFVSLNICDICKGNWPINMFESQTLNKKNLCLKYVLPIYLQKKNNWPSTNFCNFPFGLEFFSFPSSNLEHAQMTLS